LVMVLLAANFGDDLVGCQFRLWPCVLRKKDSLLSRTSHYFLLVCVLLFHITKLLRLIRW
jgi:hypothetical protein